MIILFLGIMNAEERLSNFILSLSDRFYEQGYSSNSITLSMKREEIGSYLGIKIEIVSRILTKLQKRDLLEVQLKNIRILNVNELKKVANY